MSQLPKNNATSMGKSQPQNYATTTATSTAITTTMNSRDNHNNKDSQHQILNSDHHYHGKPHDDNNVGQQPLVPPGVVAIYHACSTIYKNQPNPLQVTAVRKYW